MIKANVQIIEDLRNFLCGADMDKCRYTTYPGAFTKPKKIGFMAVILFLLNMPRKSLGVEIEHYFELLGKGASTPTKSAMSQARYKLKPVFFIAWNKRLQESFYSENDGRVKRWGNRILHGVDGSTLHLMNREEVVEKFGCHSNQHGHSPMARMMIRYDLLNEVIVGGQIAPIKKSEDALALMDLDDVPGDVISIYDRNFLSFAFLYEHERRGMDYIMRAKVGFNNKIREFVASKQASDIVKFYPTSGVIKQLRERGIELPSDPGALHVEVRLIRVELKTGEIEVLVSSLKDEQAYPSPDFKELYDSRWGVETCYDVLKNKLQMAVSSGHKPEAIEQDFYVTIFVANLNSVLIKDCEEQVEQKTRGREHDYKINRNISIGLMKDEVVRFFILDKEKVALLLLKMKDKFLRHLEPIRPDRSFVRSKKKKALGSKYHTLTNYRRAI